MKLQDLVGRIAIRTRVIEDSDTFMRSGPDASHTYHPIMIEAIEQGVCYYRDKPNGEVMILSARYNDDHWAPVSEKYMPAVWREGAEESP